MQQHTLIRTTALVLATAGLVTLTACGGGTSSASGTVNADQFEGGAGDDTYVVNHAGDTVIEGIDAGIDTISSSVTYALASNVENLTLTGTTAINGTGNELNNVLIGNSASNVLDGGVGADILTGGAGADRFVFTVNLGPTNQDTITDFSVTDNDTMALASSVFAKLAGKTNLANHFRLSTQAAVGDDDYIVYNPANGQLSYDDTGSGANSGLVFATLANKPQNITASQFVVL